MIKKFAFIPLLLISYLCTAMEKLNGKVDDIKKYSLDITSSFNQKNEQKIYTVPMPVLEYSQTLKNMLSDLAESQDELGNNSIPFTIEQPIEIFDTLLGYLHFLNDNAHLSSVEQEKIMYKQLKNLPSKEIVSLCELSSYLDTPLVYNPTLNVLKKYIFTKDDDILSNPSLQHLKMTLEEETIPYLACLGCSYNFHKNRTEKKYVLFEAKNQLELEKVKNETEPNYLNLLTWCSNTDFFVTSRLGDVFHSKNDDAKFNPVIQYFCVIPKPIALAWSEPNKMLLIGYDTSDFVIRNHSQEPIGTIINFSLNGSFRESIPDKPITSISLHPNGENALFTRHAQHSFCSSTPCLGKPLEKRFMSHAGISIFSKKWLQYYDLFIHYTSYISSLCYDPQVKDDEVSFAFIQNRSNHRVSRQSIIHKDCEPESFIGLGYTNIDTVNQKAALKQDLESYQQQDCTDALTTHFHKIKVFSNTMAWHPKKPLIAIGGKNNYLAIAKIKDRAIKSLKELQFEDTSDSELVAVSWHPKTVLLACALAKKIDEKNTEGSIQFWNIAARTLINTYKTPTALTSLAFNPEGSCLGYTCKNDNTVYVLPFNDPKITEYYNNTFTTFKKFTDDHHLD